MGSDSKNKIDMIWGISLLALSLGGLVLNVANLLGAALPRPLAGAVVAVILLDLPVFSVYTVKKLRQLRR